MVPKLCVYLENGPRTLKISPVIPGLRVNIKNGPFAQFRDENALLRGIGGFGQFGLFTLLTF